MYYAMFHAQDPAEPLFEATPPFVRLDESDAEFVDIIHTDAMSLYSKSSMTARSVNLQKFGLCGIYWGTHEQR